MARFYRSELNLNIWACDRKHAKHQYCRISDFVVQKPMRTRSISKYHFQHRYMIFFEITRDSYASASLSLSLPPPPPPSLSLSTTCLQSLKTVWIQKISEVLPNQIRDKNLGRNKHTGSEQELMSDFASDASKEYN